MSFSELSQLQMRSALSGLRQAFFDHEQWCQALSRTLICSQIPDPSDVEDDAHHKCQFGQWLYGAGSKNFAAHPAFTQIKAAHKRVHDCGRDMLRATMNQQSISAQSYERFTTAVKEMRRGLLTTKHELQRSILNLDPLTETANRADMLTKLREEQALAKRKAHSTCIAMVDLDNFKSINDKYGHIVGDQVLVRFTHHMRSRMRSHDTIFRYGGEEFLICTPNTELEAGQAKMELLGKELAEIVIHREGHPPFTTTASFGVTVIDPDVSVQLSIERADKALYAAKAAGRNRTVIWSPSLTKRPAIALTKSSASIGGASIETSIINFSKSCALHA
jgi:diguanylate cyclase (GGDEF)-like protein